MEQRRTVVVVTGGGPVAPSVIQQLPDGAAVVAADSGVDTASALGLRIDVVVGDLDSVSAKGLAAAEAAGAVVKRFPVEKDATDLELALAEAHAMGATDIVVVGGDGGRLDHGIANALALAALPNAAARISAFLGSARLYVVHGPGSVRIEGRPGELLTLLPLGGAATGLRTKGLAYALHGEGLDAGTTRGVSNVLTEPSAVVEVEHGTVLVILPGEEAR